MTTENESLFLSAGEVVLAAADETRDEGKIALELLVLEKPTVGAEVPLGLAAPRPGHELLPGDVILVKSRREPAYRDVAKRIRKRLDAARRLRKKLDDPEVHRALKAAKVLVRFLASLAVEAGTADEAAIDEAQRGGDGNRKKTRAERPKSRG